MQDPMTFLIDTNVLITAEPFDGNIEIQRSDVNRFLRLCSTHSHIIKVHPATKEDLNRTADPRHREQNLLAYEKYSQIEEVEVPDEIWALYTETPNENDRCDARILASLYKGTVDFLITSDRKLRKNATRLGLEDQTLNPSEAADQLQSWHPQAPPPPPSVKELPVARLDQTQKIFETLREDYPGFNDWLQKVKKDSANRRCWLVESGGNNYAAIALIKTSDHHPTERNRKAIKLSTFKVSETENGRRLGELLLKTVLRWAAKEPNRPSDMFVEALKKKLPLIDFLEEFGFTHVNDKSPSEAVYLKTLDPDPNLSLGGLDYHRQYGPPAVKRGEPIYIIPIQPHYFESLFPDAPLEEWDGMLPIENTNQPLTAHGNAIRKAYLCHAKVKSIPPGSTLLFYHSSRKKNGPSQSKASEQAIVAVGVAEKTYRTSNPSETARLTLKRTVFSQEELENLHRQEKPVLTILFRHDRFPSTPWKLAELTENKVLRSWPQSIMQVSNLEGIAWVEEKLSESL